MFSSDSDYPDALPNGTTLQGGNFLVERVLGQGGAGITYLCTDTGLHRATAIKEFFPPGCVRVGTQVQTGSSLRTEEYEQAKDDFLQEGRTLAQFQHPGIVDVYTVFSENNSAYMVMEYLKGASLLQIVEQRGPLPEDEAVGYIRKVGEALEVVHREAMLHRDVKPDNVMVRENGAIVLIDFGLTQKLQTATSHGTRQLSSNTRFGTAGYAPLEQYSAHAQTGVFTDIYALAATLYYLLTGQAPPEATERAAGVELTDPRAINLRLSIHVLQALSQGLEMDARERPQSVQAFLDLLQYPQQLQRAQPASPNRPPTYSPEPIEIDIPGYSSQPPQRIPPQRSPQPMPPPRTQPEDFEDPFRDPFRQPPMPIVFPGFGCMRGFGCVSGCLFFIVLFILQLLGSIFVLDW